MGKIRVKKLSDKEYKVINNVLLKTSSGKTVQIDHIILSNYGIFVVEIMVYCNVLTIGGTKWNNIHF